MLNRVMAADRETARLQVEQIELRNVHKSFTERRLNQRTEVLRQLNLSLPVFPGNKFVVLLGPSGCGKSTVLNLISGWLQPEAGEVLIASRLPQPQPEASPVIERLQQLDERPIISQQFSLRKMRDVVILANAKELRTTPTSSDL